MLPSIGFISFLESTIVPIPLETILVPLMQTRREKLWLIAVMATIGCLIGALLFYALGYFLFEVFRELIMQHITSENQFENFKQRMQTDGFLFVFSTGVTPVPLQVATLAAGVTSYNLLLFIIAITISRVIRYFGLAILVYYFGNKTEKLVRQYKWQVGLGILALIIIIWLALNFL
ncbi:YqaA family protein [Glaciecola sp. KUL10]|uniref:YqaA family protein n=1 Tax=Glaciecola sp. (strain KUL10) TaxID=2161813 RepID=UPI000D788C82|nr:VTT domain-containing protein [Glaciecola sp. KUL10]GBL06184.1 DedA family protein [Glaciecola sp. KUL10]